MKSKPAPALPALPPFARTTGFLLAASFALALGAPRALGLEYRYDTSNNTIVLENFPNLTDNFVSGGTDGTPATGNRIILKGSGNLFVGVQGDKAMFPDPLPPPTVPDSEKNRSGFESMSMEGDDWLIGGDVLLTGTASTTLHVTSGKVTIGSPLASRGLVYLAHGGDITIDSGATLQLGYRNASGAIIGVDGAGIINNGSIIFMQTNGALDLNISGAGAVYLEYSNMTLSGTNTYSGGTFIDTGTLAASNFSAIGTGRVTFAAFASTLSLLGNSRDSVLNNELVGPGRVLVDMGSVGATMSFGDGVGDQFRGSLWMTQGILNLDNEACELALQNASVRMDRQSTLIVGSGTKSLGNLTLGNSTASTSALATARQAGIVDFAVDMAGATAPQGDSFLKVGNLIVASTGTYVMSGTIRLGSTLGAPPTAPTQQHFWSVFEQDDANIITQLIASSGSNNTAVSSLALVDKNNAVISDAQKYAVVQGASGTVATATYDYRLTTGPANDGLYVNYGLTNLDILPGKTLDLRNNDGVPLNARTLTASITGTGGMEINATGAIWLSGARSSYTGATIVNSGTVNFGHTRAFGNTTMLTVKPGAYIDMQGRAQLVNGGMVLEPGSHININGGYLIVACSATGQDTIIAPNSLSGSSGNLRFTSAAGDTANVIFQGDNPDLALTFNPNYLSNTGRIIVQSANALGRCTVSLGSSRTMVYQNVTGTANISTDTNSGILLFQSSTMVLTGAIRHSTRLVDSDITFGPTSAMTISDTTRYIGVDATSTLRIGIIGNTRSIVTSPIELDGGTLDFVPFERGGDVSRVSLASIAGNGTIWINANPNTGASNMITFGKTAGSFAFKVRFTEQATSPAGVMPAYAYAFDTPASDQTAQITLADGQAESGVYVFSLVQGELGNILMPDPRTWYLAANQGAYSRAAQAILATAATAGMEWHYSLDSVTKRMGDLRQEFKVGGPKSAHGNLWARASNYDLVASDSFVGSRFTENVWAFNVGADVAISTDTATSFIGLFTGYSRVDREFRRLGNGSTDSNSAGFYITWLNDKGWFADVVAKFDKMRNKFSSYAADGRNIRAGYATKMYGFSLETGRQVNLGKTRAWWIEPGIQAATAMIEGARYKTDSGINVAIADTNSQQYRAQVRLGYNERGAKFCPYAKLAAVYLTTGGGAVTADGRSMRADFDGLRAEAGAGGSYVLSLRSQVYMEYEFANADTYTRRWSFNLGYRRTW